MKQDIYGQIILDQWDCVQALLRNPEIELKNVLTDTVPTVDSQLIKERWPEFIQYTEPRATVAEFDSAQQSRWHMPPQYQELDIAAWLLDRCETDEQRQRVGQELLLYLERDLFPLLQYLKYLVDTLTEHNVVWGVGRGSSVASYVLYLIGVHRIDSIYYGLDVHEFLR